MSARVVLKLGGAVARQAVAQARELAAGGTEVVVVHGAGPQISEALRRQGIEVTFVNGRRVTTEAVVQVVRESLRKVGVEVAGELGDVAVPLMGDEIGLDASRLPELGYVGEPVVCRPPAIEDVLASGRIPVVAPIARGPLNVNADEAAAALAVGLEADRVIFVTDVPGVLLEGAVAERIEAVQADRLLASGAFEGGIVPKLFAAVRAARLGVRAEIGVTEVLA
jgi:acetylglutamate kinase